LLGGFPDAGEAAGEARGQHGEQGVVFARELLLGDLGGAGVQGGAQGVGVVRECGLGERLCELLECYFLRGHEIEGCVF